MRKAFIVASLLLFLVLAVPAGAQWAKAYGSGSEEAPMAVLFNSEGKLVLTGFTKSIFTTYSYGDVVPDETELEYRSWFMEISGDGTAVEKYSLGSQKAGVPPDSRILEWMRSLQPTVDGGYILAGHMETGWSEGSLITDYKCAFLLKLSSDLQIEWQRFLGNDDRDSVETVLSVEPTDDGGYIAVGSTSSFGMGGHDVWVLKLDSAGQVTWQRAFGGEGKDTAHLVRQTPDGGYMVVGYASSFQPEPDSPEGEAAGEVESLPASRIWALRLNPEGSPLWQQLCGRDNDKATSMALSSDGGAWIMGSTEPEPEEGQEPHCDILLFKLSEEGSVVFQRIFGNASNECITHLIQRSEKKFLAVGTQELDGDQDLLLIQFADTGHIDWMQVFGAGDVDGEISQERGAAVAIAERDEIIVVGNTSRLGPQENDLLVLRLNPEGRIPNCDLLRELERYPLKDQGTLPVATMVDFTASEVGDVEITFHPSLSPMGIIRDVCTAKKNLLRR